MNGNDQTQMVKILRSLYDFMLGLANHPHAPLWLFLIAFIESSVFPIPPDIMLIPMCIAAKRRAFLFAFICLAGSVLGGMAGYGVGFYLFEQFGRPIMIAYGHGDMLEMVQASYQAHGMWFVFTSATTPIPYKIFTIASGALQLEFFSFVGISILGRGIRFFLVALLLYYFGQPIRNFIEKYLGWVSLVAVCLLVGGFIWIAYQA
ncbi:MAG: YqaA family protein [Alphaproteobacteria bacterium]